MRGSSLKSPSQNRTCPIKAYGSSISHLPNTHFSDISLDTPVDVSLGYENGTQKVYLNGEDVSIEIRQEVIGNMTSAIAVYGPVREILVKMQQELAAKNNVVMDGRDIGTAVLPNADLKIYLTASSRTRAERRYKELVEKGQKCNIDDIEKDIIDRDYRDMHREVSPLVQAEDAVLVESSDMTIEQVVEAITKLVK